MKQISITAFFLNIIIVRGQVTFSTKSEDVTTLLLLNKTNNGVDSKSVDKINSLFKRFNVNDTRVYLDDVVFGLKNQNWTKEEEPCLNRTLLWLTMVQNFTLWAVWNWDSLSSEPQGVFYGNRYQLGNFDECMNPPWYKEHPETRSQYCLADIMIHGTDRPVKGLSNQYDPYQSALNWFQYKSLYKRTLDILTWGICVPDLCEPRSIEKFLKVMLAHSHLGAASMYANISINEECQKTELTSPFDEQFYAFVGVTVFVVVLSLVSTCLNQDRRDLDKHTPWEQFIGAFDIKLNSKLLLNESDQGLKIISGIKSITMIYVVCSHQFCLLNAGAVSNGLDVDKTAEGLFGDIFLHTDVCVDTFFCVSGFLLAKSMAKLKKMPNLFRLIFIRYMRLIIAYAAAIFYISSIFPYTGSGPLWNRAMQEAAKCRKNWWLNLLMVNNYIDIENICLVASWYIPCDFHFFLISLLLLWIYQKFPSSGRVLFCIVTIAAIITPGIITYINELPPTELFTYNLLINIRSGKPFQITYIKSHTRYAANLIGFFGGHIFTYCCTSERLKRIPQKWSVAGALFGLLTMSAILFTGPIFLWRDYSVLESAAYAALNRPVYSCGVVMFIICCSLGNVPIIKGFLSWYPFVPLSKLSYGIYLTHIIFIARNVSNIRNPEYYNSINIFASGFGFTLQSLLAAFILWLLAEAPINNLVKICFQRKSSGLATRRLDGSVTRVSQAKGDPRTLTYKL